MDLVSGIESCLMKMWQFRKFTESRWLIVVSSCHVLVDAMLTGVEDLVAAIVRDPPCTETFLPNK